MQLGRRHAACVARWPYLVLESDEAPADMWLRALVQLPLPIVAAYTSGGRSIHALVRVNAESKAEWDGVRDDLVPIVCPLGADAGALSAVRLSRLPGCLRHGKRAPEGKLQRFGPAPRATARVAQSRRARCAHFGLRAAMKKKPNGTDGAEAIREQLPRLAAATGAPAPGDGHSLPSIAVNETISVLALAVAQCLRRAPLFRRGESLVTVDESAGEVLPMTADRWPSWHQQFFTFHTGDGEKWRAVDMEPNRVRRILASDALRAHVRELRGVNLLRLPVWRGEGSCRKPDLLPEGYDAVTRTFTAPLLNYATDWRLEDAQAWLDATFGAFPFFESGKLFARRSFAALVAAMVGVFTVNLLPDGAVRPLVLVDGNQVKLGKSLLVRMILSFVHGKIGEGSKPKSDEELRKILDATAIAGKPYLFLDDLRNLASNDLNHFSSSPTHEPRAMHTLNLPNCPNVWQVFGTGKDIKLTEDLERRVLPIDLFASDDWRARKVANPWTNPQIILPAYRSAACSAIWALVKNWIEAGMPKGGTRLDSFEDWSEIVGGVVVAAGIADPCGPRENTRGGNDAGRALVAAVCSLAAKCDHGEELTTVEILVQLDNDGTLDVVVPTAKNDLGQRQKLGWKLQPLRGNAYTDTRGRRFEFGHKDDAAGSKYTLHFLDSPRG